MMSIRHQLAGLGYTDNDIPGPDDPSMLPVFLDIHGNPIPPPVVVNPLTGETSLDPSVIIVQSPANQISGESYGTRDDGSAFASLPGVKSGAIPINSTASVVVTPRDMAQTGILDVSVTQSPMQQAAAGTYVGPLPPAVAASLPAPAPAPIFAPAPAPAPSGRGSSTALPVLPSWAPSLPASGSASSAVAADGGDAAAGGSAQASAGNGGKLALLALAALLFAN